MKKYFYQRDKFYVHLGIPQRLYQFCISNTVSPLSLENANCNLLFEVKNENYRN